MAKHEGEADRIIAVVEFNGRQHVVLDAAASLAAATGMELCLVHVSEPPPQVYWGDLPMVLPAAAHGTGLEGESDEELVRDRQRLLTLGRALGDDVRWTCELLVGDPLERLHAMTTRPDVAMVIVGIAESDYENAMGEGMSFAMGLVGSATVPVIAVPHGRALTFAREGFRIMCADDFRDATRDALQTAIALASRLRHAEVCHVHVSHVNEAAVRQKLKKALGAAHVPITSDADVDQIVLAMEQQIKDKLAERAQPFLTPLFARGGRYVADVAAGSPAIGLAGLITRHRPDIVVYGKHKMLHWKPFALGRMPFKAMLEKHLPVMVVEHDATRGMDAHPGGE